MTSSAALTLTVNPQGAGGETMVADNIARFSGALVDHYASARPIPPAELRSLLIKYATDNTPLPGAATSSDSKTPAAASAPAASSGRVKVVVDIGTDHLPLTTNVYLYLYVLLIYVHDDIWVMMCMVYRLWYRYIDLSLDRSRRSCDWCGAQWWYVRLS